MGWGQDDSATSLADGKLLLGKPADLASNVQEVRRLRLRPPGFRSTPASGHHEDEGDKRSYRKPPHASIIPAHGPEQPLPSGADASIAALVLLTIVRSSERR